MQLIENRLIIIYFFTLNNLLLIKIFDIKLNLYSLIPVCIFMILIFIYGKKFRWGFIAAPMVFLSFTLFAYKAGSLGACVGMLNIIPLLRLIKNEQNLLIQRNV